MEDIGKDISDQLLADLRAASCFSIAVDENTDVTDVAQLCTWVRFPKENCFQEEMLCLLPLHGQTRGEDILNALLVFFEENNLSWSKLASVKPLAQKVMSFFMSTYTCESTFSTMNTIKGKQRNRLTHGHLECLTVIATTKYKYNMKKVKDMHASFRSSQY